MNNWVRRHIHNKNMDKIPLVWKGISLGTRFHTLMCERRHLQRGLTKSTIAEYEVESTTWDSAEIEEGIFVYGGNPNGWGPWRYRAFNCYIWRGGEPFLFILMIIHFMSIQTLCILCCLARIIREFLFRILPPFLRASWRICIDLSHI